LRRGCGIRKLITTTRTLAALNAFAILDTGKFPCCQTIGLESFQALGFVVKAETSIALVMRDLWVN
jgi:hypothetical protein